MNFHQELIVATQSERKDLLAIPFIREGASGKLGLASYLAFLEQAYQHVKHTLPLLMACGARLAPSLEWLRVEVAEYIKEETGHQEWILNDITAAGGDAERVRNARPSLATELMVAYAYDTVNRGNPVGFFGMVLVLEGTSVELAISSAANIQKVLWLPAAAFSYLRSHGTLDLEHIEHFRSLMNRLESPADRQAVIHCARVFYRLYGDIFRSLPMEPLGAQEAVA